MTLDAARRAELLSSIAKIEASLERLESRDPGYESLTEAQYQTHWDRLARQRAEIERGITLAEIERTIKERDELLLDLCSSLAANPGLALALELMRRKRDA